MVNNKFIEMCKTEVVKYHNAHQDPEICIDESHVFVVWQCKTLQNHKAMLGVMMPDGDMYYEITYDGNRGEMYVDVYKKETNIYVELDEPQAELGRTVHLMLSPFYEDKFRAEYNQLRIRHEKLETLLKKIVVGTIDFTPKCSYELLKSQLDVMSKYIEILKERAKIEGIRVI